MVNKHAQALGRLAGAKKTKVEMRKMAKARWIDMTPEQRRAHGAKASERMRKYWIGWRKNKEAEAMATHASAKKAFDKLM